MEKREHHFESFGSNGNFPRGKLLKNVAAERKVENIIWIWEGNSRNLAQSNFQGMAGSRESALLWKLKSCWFFSSIQEKSDASSKRQWVESCNPITQATAVYMVEDLGSFQGINYQLSNHGVEASPSTVDALRITTDGLSASTTWSRARNQNWLNALNPPSSLDNLSYHKPLLISQFSYITSN